MLSQGLIYKRDIGICSCCDLMDASMRKCVVCRTSNICRECSQKKNKIRCNSCNRKSKLKALWRRLTK